MDPLEAFLMITRLTTTAPNFAGEVGTVMPIVVTICGVSGGVLGCALVFYLGQEHFKSVIGTVTGAPRLLKAYRSDPVSAFAPSSVPQDPNRDAPLPPLRTKE